MPRKVAVLLLLLAVTTLMRVVEAANTGEAMAWFGVAMNVAFIVGIMRGSEGARAVLRGFAALGLVIVAISLLIVAASGLLATPFGLIGLLTGVLSGLVSGFMFWCLGQEDVVAWITARRLDIAE